MKLLLVLYFVLILNSTSCFIPYPFLADSWLVPLLENLHEKLHLDADASEKWIELVSQQDDIWTRGEECNRECTKNDARICRFDFTMKYFQVMGG